VFAFPAFFFCAVGEGVRGFCFFFSRKIQSHLWPAKPQQKNTKPKKFGTPVKWLKIKQNFPLKLKKKEQRLSTPRRLGGVVKQNHPPPPPPPPGGGGLVPGAHNQNPPKGVSAFFRGFVVVVRFWGFFLSARGGNPGF